MKQIDTLNTREIVETLFLIAIELIDDLINIFSLMDLMEKMLEGLH